MQSLLVIVCVVLIPIAQSHSWIACAKYSGSIDNYDESQCEAFARGYYSYSSSYFGLDRGFNHRLSYQDPVCKVDYTEKAYGGSMGPLRIQGENSERIRLIWPAKNHVSDKCTNPYIPDRQLKLYANCQYARENPSLQNFLTGAQLLWDFKRDGTAKGFQQCVNFCANPDKAVCYGDVTIPKLPYNECLLVWLWEFNANEFYTSCIDTFPKAPSNTKLTSTTTVVPTTKNVSKCVLTSYLKSCERNLNRFKKQNC